MEMFAIFARDDFILNHHWHGINVLSIFVVAFIAALVCSGLAVVFEFVRKSKRLTALSIAGTIFFATAAYAANTALSNLSASGALAGANLIYVVQTAGTGGVKATMTQVATFINSLFSGDFTVASGGAATLKNTGPGATGPIGSTTTVPVVTIDAQGRVTALSSATAAGTVSSVSAGCGTSTGGSPITTTGTVSSALTLRSNTAATDTIVSTDCGNAVYENRATAVAVAIAQAGTAGFGAGAYFLACNINAGVATITPTTSTIGGAATLAIPPGTAAAPVCYGFQSDGTNYNIVEGPPFKGANTWTGVQTFGSTIGAVSTQSGTTYTLANTDCGTTVRFTNASAVTVTIPQALTVGCVIAIEQAAAGAVSVNGSAVTPATLHSAHSYTKTSAQWAVIGIFTESSNVAILTGDGA